MYLKQDTVKQAKLPRTKMENNRFWRQRFLLILSTTLVTYNFLTALIASSAYLPPSLYNRAYDCMSLEGPGAFILYRMFILLPSSLFLATTIGLLLGGSLGALSGMLFLTPFDSTTARALLLGAKIGSVSGMALCTTLLSLPQRFYLLTTATDFFDLYALGGIHTIQIGCQYGAYPLALLHLHYAVGLLLLIALTIISSALINIRRNTPKLAGF